MKCLQRHLWLVKKINSQTKTFLFRTFFVLFLCSLLKLKNHELFWYIFLTFTHTNLSTKNLCPELWENKSARFRKIMQFISMFFFDTFFVSLYFWFFFCTPFLYFSFAGDRFWSSRKEFWLANYLRCLTLCLIFPAKKRTAFCLSYVGQLLLSFSGSVLSKIVKGTHAHFCFNT